MTRRVIFVDPAIWTSKNHPAKENPMSELAVPTEDCRRAAAMLCHLATGDQAGYEMVGAEAAAAGRLHGLLGAVLFLVDVTFGEELRNPAVIQELRDLAVNCTDEENHQ